MGMYTELHYNSQLNKDIPSKIIKILRLMVEGENQGNLIFPDHPLFKTHRWETMLRCDSYYFDADTHSTLRYDEITDAYFLCIRTNTKNYGKEIEKFIDFMNPYIYKFNGEFLGFYRYEENNEPTLIYCKK